MGDLVCVRIFFPKTSGDRILFPDIQRCKIFFPRIIRHERYFFSLQDIVFCESPILPAKSQMVGPLSRSIFPSQIKGPKNYIQLQHLHPIEIQLKVYLRKLQILC